MKNMFGKLLIGLMLLTSFLCSSLIAQQVKVDARWGNFRDSVTTPVILSPADTVSDPNIGTFDWNTSSLFYWVIGSNPVATFTNMRDGRSIEVFVQNAGLAREADWLGIYP